MHLFRMFLGCSVGALLAAGSTACTTTSAASAPAVEAKDAVVSDAAGPGQPAAGERVIRLDFNNDKRPDVFKYYAEGSEAPKPAEGAATPAEGATTTGDQDGDALRRKEVDLNADGKIDLWAWYSDTGAVEKQVFDLDYDGKPDLTAYFEKGVVVRKESIHAGSESPDTFRYYEKGKLVRVERDTNHDGKIDNWEYWDGDQVDRVGSDKNGDGNVDVWTKPKKS